MINIKYYKIYFLTVFVLVSALTSCSKEQLLNADPFVVAFNSLSKNLIEIENEENILLVYSEIAQEDGSVIIDFITENAEYGLDFVTVPEAAANTITLPIIGGEIQNSIVFKKLNPALDETTEIFFRVISINYENSNIQGNSSFLINASASLGGSFNPEVGGPNQGNQVYVDLSSQSASLVERDSWDLGFYNGDNFRVTLNGSIFMAAKALASTNIDPITQDDVSAIQSQVAVGTFDPDN